MSAGPLRGGGWTLRRRLTVAVAAGLVLVLLGLAAGGVLLLRTREEQARVTEDYFTAHAVSYGLFAGLIDQETAVRGFALSGDEEYLEPYLASTRRASADYELLLQRLEGSPAVLERLRVAAAAGGRWREEWAEPALADLRAGGTLGPADLRRGKELFDDVRRDFRAYQAQLLAEREEVTDDLRRDTALLFATAVAGAAGALLAGLALLLALRRWVTHPLESLASETRTVSAGDLQHPVRVSGPPEVEALGADVEAMRRGLLAQLGVLEAAKAELEESRHRLQEQARELQRSNTELEQFAYVASHDLQEPLRKVASFCQMLARRYEGQLDERADQYIAFAVDGAKRMQQLINDLLAFSRVGRMSTGATDVDLGTCLAQALRNLSAAVEETGAVVTADPLPVVRGEAGLLTQVFQNLVGNGIKFRGDGAPRVHIGVERSGDEWVLCCADDGIGIEAAYAERIFVIFQRLHAKDAYEGTGIGLAMCRKIVEHHGGRIWLDTSAGEGARGTVFRWTLPVREAVLGVVADVVDAAPVDGRGTGDVEVRSAPARVGAPAGRRAPEGGDGR